MKAPSLFLFTLAAVSMLSNGAPVSAQIVNGDFETGPWQFSVTGKRSLGFGWTRWPASGPPAYWHNNDSSGAQGIDSLVGINDYQRTISGAIQSSSFNGGIYQIVPVSAGTTYDLDFYARFLSDSVSESDIGRGYVGVDLAGGTNSAAGTIQWYPNPPTGTPPLPGLPDDNRWSKHTLRFTATGSNVTIFTRSFITSPQSTVLLDVDNFVLTANPLPRIVNSAEPDIRVSMINETAYEVRWTTDTASDSTIEYGFDTGDPSAAPDDNEVGTMSQPKEDGTLTYTNTMTDAALVTNHVMVLSGLTLGKEYNFRVISNAAGRKAYVSTNRKFNTPPVAAAFFSNGSFEAGTCSGGADCNGSPDGWTKFGVVDGRQGPAPASGGANFFGIKASEGSFFIASAASSTTKNGGYYQRIVATPGKTYTAEFDFKNFFVGASANDQPTLCLLGIDPKGGVDPNSADIVWNSNFPYKYVSNPSGAWSTESVAATAQANAITVFVKFIHKFAIPFNITAIDNVRVSLPLYTASSIGDAKTQPNGTNIDFTTEQIVTLVPVSQSGFFYMQDQDGSAGIRVEPIGSPAVAIGSKVQVTGKLDTNANGERALKAALVTINGTGSTPIRIMNNKAVGGEGYADISGSPSVAGLSSEGLLVKVFGNVTLVDFVNDYFIIDDGSNLPAGDPNGDSTPDVGIRVTFTGGNLPFNPNAYVTAIGVVTPDIQGGKKVRVLRGREDFSEVVDLNP